MRLFFYTLLFIHLLFTQLPNVSSLGSLGYSFWQSPVSTESMSPHKTSNIEFSTMNLFEMKDLALSSLNVFSRTIDTGFSFRMFRFNSYSEYQIDIEKVLCYQDLSIEISLSQHRKMIKNFHDQINYSVSSGFAYKFKDSFILFDYQYSSIKTNSSLLIKYVEEFRLFTSQIIYSSSLYKDDLALLLEYQIMPFTLAMAWNLSTEDLGFEVNFYKNSYYCSVGIRFHPILGYSKAISIAFLL